MEIKMKYQMIMNNIQRGNAPETGVLVKEAVRENQSPEAILKEALIPGMMSVMEKFKRKEISMPETLIAARALNKGIKIVREAIGSSRIPVKGTVVIGTLKGDTGDIERSLISISMESLGLHVVDLGSDVSHDRFIDAAIRERAKVIACSAMLVSAMIQMKAVVQAAIMAGIRKQIKIVLIGAPVTEKYCHLIGADMYAAGITEAAKIAADYCSGAEIRDGPWTHAAKQA